MKLLPQLTIPELADRLSAVHERVTEASSMLESLRVLAASSMTEGFVTKVEPLALLDNDGSRTLSCEALSSGGQPLVSTWHVATAAPAKAPIRLPAVVDPSPPPLQFQDEPAANVVAPIEENVHAPQVWRRLISVGKCQREVERFNEEVRRQKGNNGRSFSNLSQNGRAKGDDIRYTMGGHVDLRSVKPTFMMSEDQESMNRANSDNFDIKQALNRQGSSGSDADPRRGSVFGATGMGLRNSAVNAVNSTSSSVQGRPSARGVNMAIQMGGKLKGMVKPTIKKPKGWLINPADSKFLQIWDPMTAVALTFVAFVAPVQVSMLEAEFDVLFGINCVVDLMFCIDLVLQFFLKYTKKTDWGYKLEHDHTKIVRHYLKTWFVVDLLSIIPFDMVALVSQSRELKQMKAVKVVRLMRLLKLVRVAKASRLFRRFEVRMSMTYGTLALLKFFCILMLITHWLANLWALTLIFVEENDNVPRWIDKFNALEETVEQKTKNTPWKLYIHCLYFTSYTITSVGYGDIGPQNIVETIVCTTMVILSGISWAIVLGQVCGTIAQFGADDQAFRSTMDELNRMMNDHGFARPMQLKLRSFFLSNRVWASRARYQKVIEGLSPGLQGEVCMQLNRMWIQKVSFLNSILEEAEQSDHGSYFYSFVVDIVMKMQGVYHAQAEVFGELQALYILNRGLVSRPGSFNSAGAVWGIDFVLSDLRLLENPACLALTYVEAMVLHRNVFLDLVERHNLTCPGLKRKVRTFCCWVAFQRAFLKEAKRRRKKKRLADMVKSPSD